MTERAEIKSPASDPFSLVLPDRVVVTGANGAGKTWLALRLAEAGYPLIHQDALKLTTGWQTRPRDETDALLREALSNPRWIAEGGPSLLQPFVLERTELVIWLDPGAGTRVRRLLWRPLQSIFLGRPELPEGNRERPGLRSAVFAIRSARREDRFTQSIEVALSAFPDLPVQRIASGKTALNRFGPAGR